MILDTISNLELKSIYTIRVEEKKINSLLRLKQYLSKIDFNTEDVPLISTAKFKSLLESLKGDELDADETSLIKELVNDTDQ